MSCSRSIGGMRQPDDSGERPSRLLFESALVRIGSFRCPIGHPSFPDSGPTQTFCFVFPRTAVWIEHAGSKPFVADANVIPLYNRAHPYRRRAISPHGDRTDWFGVVPELLREALACHDPAAANEPDVPFRFGFGPSTPRLYAWQRAVFEVVARGRPDDWFVEESVAGILSAVLRGLYGDASVRLASPRRQREVVEDARARLALTYSSNESLSQLAAAAGVSVFHLCRIFRRLAGTTLHRYRSQLRMHDALERLCDPGADILSVAMQLGYSGHSHFTAAFRSAFGCSPSEWRGASAYSFLSSDGAALPALRR
jgi:AraC-like DNA-binding protein